MNLTELSDLMHERSKHDPIPVLTESRISGIQRRVTAARRRRIAGTLAGLVAVVAAVGLPVVHGFNTVTHRSKGTAATASMRKINGFDEYADGGHLVASVSHPYAAGSVTLSAVANPQSFLISNSCPTIDSNTTEIDVRMAVNGHSAGEMSCNSGHGEFAGYTAAQYKEWGVTVGDAVTFTFAPKAYALTRDTNGNQTSRTATQLPAGSFSVAVYQKLAFTDYPLPPRPKTLPPLDINEYGLGADEQIQHVTSDPNNPLAPQTYRFTMPTCARPGHASCVDTALTAQTPGQIDVRVNGVLVDVASFWDYSAGGYSIGIDETMTSIEAPYTDLHLTPGESVTITLTPHYLTGRWEFAAGLRKR